jgi:hypothetical protein
MILGFKGVSKKLWYKLGSKQRSNTRTNWWSYSPLWIPLWGKFSLIPTWRFIGHVWKLFIRKWPKKKMVNVVTTKVDPQEKVEWLNNWNGDQIIWDQNLFPPRLINGPTLNPWLNRITFWCHVHIPMYLHIFVFYTTCQYAWMNVFSIVNTFLTTWIFGSSIRLW